MVKIGRCCNRYVLQTNRTVLIHVSEEELVSIVKSGMAALAKKRDARPCKACKQRP